MKVTYCHPSSAPAEVALGSGDRRSLSESFPSSGLALSSPAVGERADLPAAHKTQGAFESPKDRILPPSFAVVIHRENISGKEADESRGCRRIVSSEVPFRCNQVSEPCASKESVSQGEFSASPSCTTGGRGKSECSEKTSSPTVSNEYLGIEGYDRPDLNKALIGLRLPPYIQHIKYECLQIRRFWASDMHHRDWRQTFATCYFPNIIDPLLLAVIRFCLCCCVLLLEVFSSASSVEVAGFAHFLYFTNWNSLMVAAGFVSLTASSVWACLSFREPPFLQHPEREEKHGDAKRNVVRLAKHYHASKSQCPEQPVDTPASSELQGRERAVRCLLPVAFVSLESTNHWPPRPSYNCSKVALLPWIVQCREQRLQLAEEGRPSRASCLQLKGYVQLMADERFCVEGILFAPNPSNRSSYPAKRNLRQPLLRRFFWTPLNALFATKRLHSVEGIKTKESRERNTCGEASQEEDAAGRVPSETPSPHSTASRSSPSAPRDSGLEQEESAADDTERNDSLERKSVAPFPLFVQVTWILHSLQLVGSVGVFVIFFSLFKFEGTAFPESWVTIYKHAALVGITFLHACLLSRIPFPLRHAVFSFALFCCYLTVQLLVFWLQLSNGNGGVGYVYRVFSFEKVGAATATVVGVVSCFFAIHVFLWSLTRRRSLYIDPPPGVSVTAQQLREALQLASAAAATAVGAASSSQGQQGHESEGTGHGRRCEEPVSTAVLAVAAAAVQNRLQLGSTLETKETQRSAERKLSSNVQSQRLTQALPLTHSVETPATATR